MDTCHQISITCTSPNIPLTSSSLKNFTGRAVLFSYLLLSASQFKEISNICLQNKVVFYVVGGYRKFEVSFWELTRVVLLETCPSLLEYTAGPKPPLCTLNTAERRLIKLPDCQHRERVLHSPNRLLMVLGNYIWCAILKL